MSHTQRLTDESSIDETIPTMQRIVGIVLTNFKTKFHFMKNTFLYSDYGYKSAVNFDGRNYYHAPCTITIDSPKCLTKHKYILPVGSSDSIAKWHKDGYFYILSTNKGLGYIGLSIIEVCTGNIEDYYIDNVDDSIFDLSDKRIATHILSNF